MQASSLPNPPSILAQLYPRQLENSGYLNIPSIVTSPSIPTSVSESFLINYSQEQLNSPVSQAISAPVTPTSSVTPGFSQPPRRGKGNQNGSNSTSNDGKSNGSKSNSNLAHIPCKFFKSGACTAGKNCVFSHSKDPPSDNYVCKYFLKGNCKFGSKCALSHTLPNDQRKSSSNGRNGSSKNANGSRNSISNGIIPEIRSPIMVPQGYSQELNDYQPLNSPGIPPFTRIPIGSSEYANNNRQFSQLTASLNDPSAFSEENHTAPRLRNVSTNYNNEHLSAPININGQQRRSLPDIFHLGGPVNNNNNNSHSHNYNRNPNNNTESFGTSPFHNPGSKSIFLPLSYVSDSGMLSPTVNPHQHLHSIPELHDYSHHEDIILDDFGAYEYEELHLPSSLNELLTPSERERRQSRQEENSELSPRRLFNGSSMLNPMPIDQHLNYYNSHVDPTHIHFAGRSLPHGIGVGLAANYMNQNEGHQVNTYNGNHPFGFPSGTSMRNNTSFIEDWNEQLSPLSPFHSQNHPFNHNNNPSGYSTDNHGQFSGTPAINIPEVHQTDKNSPMYGIISRPNVNINGNGNNGNGRSTTPPDPFSPFGPDDDFFFNMEEDKNDQVSTEVSSSKSSEQPKTPLSYSAITKTGLKDSGATPGLSIDSRRYEPLCPFGIAGNCRYGDRCHYLHGMPCPSCLKPILHPYHSSEEHQAHINECINKQVQVADDVRPEELECKICFEKVLSKADARFGLLNCEHAFCLQCIRQWRSNITVDNQVIRTCPVCKTPSHFVTPSTTWITDRAEKQRVINEYKRKCSTIPCRNFNYGEGECQFGTSCFYAHTYRDGTKEEVNIRTIQNGDKVKILDNVRLSDFIKGFTTEDVENFTNRPSVIDNENNSNPDEAKNNCKNNDNNNSTNDSMDNPTATITTLMSNLSVNSPVFIPSINETAVSVEKKEKE